MNDELMMVSADTLAEMFRKSHVVDEATMTIVLPIFQAAVELAADAVKAEREACAKIIDDNAEGSGLQSNNRLLVPRTEGNLAGTAYAAAIRARGKT